MGSDVNYVGGWRRHLRVCGSASEAGTGCGLAVGAEFFAAVGHSVFCFRTGPVVTRTSDWLPVVRNVSGFAIGALVAFLTPVLGKSSSSSENSFVSWQLADFTQQSTND